MSKSPRRFLSPRGAAKEKAQASSPRQAASIPISPRTQTPASGPAVSDQERKKIEGEFRAVLTQQGIPSVAQDKMVLTLDINQQLEMIDQARRKQKKTMKTPASFVAQLKANPDAETLVSLRVYLTTESLDWLKQFRDCQGLNALCNVLVSLEREMNPSEQTNENIYECCSIVAAVAHSAEGLVMIMDPTLDTLLKTLILCLDTTDIRRLLVLYDFYSLLCLMPEYYPKVIECFTHFKTVKREPTLFYNLVQTLKNAVSKEVAAKCMAQINALISSPEDLDTRAAQRTAFLRQGLRETLLAVRQRISSDIFVVQFNLFFEDEKEDQQQLKEIMGVAAGGSGEIGDENVLVRRLFNNTKDSDLLTGALQSILESLTNFPVDADQKSTPQIWNLAASLVQQVASGVAVISLDGGATLDSDTLMGQMDYRAELMVKEEDFRSIEKELRTELKKVTTELSDAKQELIFLKEKGVGSNANIDRTSVAHDGSFLLKPEEEEGLTDEEKMAKHRLQEEEMFRLKQRLGSEAVLPTATTAATGEEAKKFEKEVQSLKEENARLAAELSSLKASGGAPAAPAADAPVPPPAPGAPPPPGGAEEAGGPPPPPPPAPPGPGEGAPPPPPPPPGAPPPPGGGAPPPPPPPGGPGAPPPPPGAPGMMAAPVKKWESPLPKPEVKMRIVNWTKLPANKAEATVFNEMKDEIADVDLDFDEMMDMFRVPDDTRHKIKAAPTQQGPVLVSLIGPKRTQSVNIFLKSSRMTTEEIMTALRTFDRSVCTLEFLGKLLENTPTLDELASIDAYEEGGGEMDLLADPEKFFKQISSVKGLQMKIKGFITLLKFPKQYDSLEPQIQSLSNAISQVNSSQKWKSLIRYVLAIGNYINGKSNRGNAMGFKLDSLNKLRDTKTSDNRSNLLNYLVQTIEKHEPAVLSLAEDFKDLSHAVRVSFISLNDDLNQMNKAVKNIEGAIDSVAHEEGDAFSKHVSADVAAKFRGQLDQLMEHKKKTEAEYEELAKAYGENPKTMSSSDFLNIINTFVQSFHAARKEIAAIKLKEEKKAAYIKQQQARNAKLTQAEAEKQADILMDEVNKQGKYGAKAPAGQGLVMNELLAGLNSGNLLRSRTETRRQERVNRTPTISRKDSNQPPPWANQLKKTSPRPSPAPRPAVNASLVAELKGEVGKEEGDAGAAPEMPNLPPAMPNLPPVNLTAEEARRKLDVPSKKEDSDSEDVEDSA